MNYAIQLSVEKISGLTSELLAVSHGEYIKEFFAPVLRTNVDSSNANVFCILLAVEPRIVFLEV